MPLLTSEQMRAARALLRWEQRVLADLSHVSLPTIKRIESRQGLLVGHKTTIQAIQNTLESAGVEFIDDTAPGVRLHSGLSRTTSADPERASEGAGHGA